MPSDRPITVLHYTGYDQARGGIMTGIGHLADTGIFRCILGVNQGFQRPAKPSLDVMEFCRLEGEKINIVNFWRARVVAQLREHLSHLKRRQLLIEHLVERRQLLIQQFLIERR